MELTKGKNGRSKPLPYNDIKHLPDYGKNAIVGQGLAPAENHFRIMVEIIKNVKIYKIRIYYCIS